MMEGAEQLSCSLTHRLNSPAVSPPTGSALVWDAIPARGEGQGRLSHSLGSGTSSLTCHRWQGARGRSVGFFLTMTPHGVCEGLLVLLLSCCLGQLTFASTLFAQLHCAHYQDSLPRQSACPPKCYCWLGGGGAEQCLTDTIVIFEVQVKCSIYFGCRMNEKFCSSRYRWLTVGIHT